MRSMDGKTEFYFASRGEAVLLKISFFKIFLKILIYSKLAENFLKLSLIFYHNSLTLLIKSISHFFRNLL